LIVVCWTYIYKTNMATSTQLAGTSTSTEICMLSTIQVQVPSIGF